MADSFQDCCIHSTMAASYYTKAIAEILVSQSKFWQKLIKYNQENFDNE